MIGVLEGVKKLTVADAYCCYCCYRLWPNFTHLLPEVAFAGHSNSGKSTLGSKIV